MSSSSSSSSRTAPVTADGISTNHVVAASGFAVSMSSSSNSSSRNTPITADIGISTNRDVAHRSSFTGYIGGLLSRAGLLPGRLINWSPEAMEMVIRNVFMLIFGNIQGPRCRVWFTQAALFTVAASHFANIFDDLDDDSDYFAYINDDLLVAMVWAVDGNPSHTEQRIDENKWIIWNALLSRSELERAGYGWVVVLERYLRSILNDALTTENNRKREVVEFLSDQFYRSYTRDLDARICAQCYNLLVPEANVAPSEETKEMLARYVDDNLPHKVS